MVVPPENACYVPAAYKPGAIRPNALAWIIPSTIGPEDDLTGMRADEIDLRRMPNIATEVAAPPACRLLGVVYSDSPLADETSTSKSLEAVSVAISGLVTIQDEAFAQKATCGQFVYVNSTTGKLSVHDERPEDNANMWQVGMLLEVGSIEDARVLLSINPPV